MDALLIEFDGDGPPGWMGGLAEELVEDPRCHLRLMGSDSHGVVLITIWEPEIVDEVEVGLAELAVDGVRLRRMSVTDPRNPVGLY